MLKHNAFKDSMESVRFLIPVGTTDISPGSRSDSDDHPGFGVLDPHPERRAREDVRTVDLRPCCDPCRGRIVRFSRFPGYSSLSLLDPGLQVWIPGGIKNRTHLNRILKGIGLQPAWLDALRMGAGVSDAG